MHSCDFTGGAWLRSTNAEEEHAFFDPGTNQLYKNNGSIITMNMVSVSNSKRGHYITVFWDSVAMSSKVAYSKPSSFWSPLSPGLFVLPDDFYTKFIRIDITHISDPNKIFYVGLLSFGSGTPSISPIRSQLYASFVED